MKNVDRSFLPSSIRPTIFLNVISNLSLHDYLLTNYSLFLYLITVKPFYQIPVKYSVISDVNLHSFFVQQSVHFQVSFVVKS